MAPEFEVFRQAITGKPQLVLTDFGLPEFKELFECEKLAFELWRCGATLRILGKDASLVVAPDTDQEFCDNRSEDLDKLVTIYDERQRTWGVSATGTVFPQEIPDWQGSGAVFLPQYNVSDFPRQLFNRLFRIFKFHVWKEFKPNFFWYPFNLEGYAAAHLPFAEAFRAVHGLSSEEIIAVIGAMCARLFLIWKEDRGNLIKQWQRAYEGPYLRDFIHREIRTFLPASIKGLQLRLSAETVDAPAVVRFLELNEARRDRIDLILCGPHSVFLPYGCDRLFIDYAWIPRLLFNLFYNVRLPDQNFKGYALEELVRKRCSRLPARPCTSLNGEQRQIDASLEVEDVLLIVECRAFARSFGIDRGERQAIQYRTERIDQALTDVDEKGLWLARNAVGRNYNIRKYRKILPIVVTPFVEFIPSLKPRYWICDGLPRVLTHRELSQAIQNGRLKQVVSESSNTILIAQS